MVTLNDPRQSDVAAAPQFAAASPREVQQWVTSGQAVIIDVREPDEYAREHIAGARLMPLSRLDTRQVATVANPGQRVVVQCKSGKRATDACRILSAAASGAQLTLMTGGIEAWKADKLPVVLNTRVNGMSVMRQVQLVIGVGLLAGSALAWFVHPAFLAVPVFFGAGLTFAGASGTCALAIVLGAMPWNRCTPST